jgi:hypothetical protein
MKNYIQFLPALVCGAALAWFASPAISIPPEVKSFGAPPGSTGAPGEYSCAKSGCHDDLPVNAGPATHALELMESAGQAYTPGRTYTLKVRIQGNQDIPRFGFQAVALDAQGRQAGSIIITDENRTQMLQNDIENKDREYFTYRHEGTFPEKAGIGEWQAEWQAPKAGTGPITFYFSTVSANYDNTDKGDYVYTASRVYQDGTTLMGGCCDLDSAVYSQEFTAMLLPGTGMLLIESAAVQNPVSISLISSKGTQMMANMNPGTANSWALPVAGIPAGAAFVRVHADGRFITIPIFIH